MSEEPQRLIAPHLSTKPPRLRSLRPDFPVALERALSRLLEKDPALRFPDMGAVFSALQAIVADELAPGGAPKATRESDPTIDLRKGR